MRRTALVALTLATVMLGALLTPLRASALIDAADATSKAGLSKCRTLFSQPGNDPYGVWQTLDNPTTPRVTFVTITTPRNGAGTKTHVEDNGDITIFWDPTHDVETGGVVSGPCEVAYHELQHASDDVDPNIDSDDLDEECGGIAHAEWRAVAAQNALRKALHLPDVRTSYRGKKFNAATFEECQQKEAALPNNPSGNSVFGDPHVVTTDHLDYDLQLVGEFTAFTSTADGAPRVQVRTAPVAESSAASLVSAVAAGTADHRVTFIPDADTMAITDVTGDTRRTVTIGEGDVVDLGAGVRLSAGAATPGFTGSSYTLRWSDGSQLYVDDKAHWGMRVAFHPADAAKSGSPRGLLGTFDGNAANDLTRPDGRVVPQDSRPAAIRSEFGDPWRITQADSLFAYGPGESTATFTDRSFPRSEPQLPAPVTERAGQICRAAGITDDAFLAACIYDVSVTGNPALAQVAAQVANDVRSARTETGPLRDGSKVTGVITDYAQGKAYDLGLDAGTVFWVADWRGTTDACDQTFTITFTDVSGLNAPCTGQAVKFVVPDDGQPHRLEIASAETGTGGYAFSIVTEKIRMLTATPGETVTGDIDVRGREDRYALPPGTRTVHVTSPLTCGGDDVDKQIGVYDLTEDRLERATSALCIGELGPWQFESPTHRYALIVNNSGLGTGTYEFTLR